jgi:hypothetical protein
MWQLTCMLTIFITKILFYDFFPSLKLLTFFFNLAILVVLINFFNVGNTTLFRILINSINRGINHYSVSKINLLNHMLHLSEVNTGVFWKQYCWLISII